MLDGGGSSTFVITTDGKAVVVNHPVQKSFKDIERPVANHIGIKVNP
jgi:hypothetical protein